jgi:predicted outer membrane protein
MKITKNQLRQIIKEEAIKLQKKTILENRKKEILRELRMLNEGVSIDENEIVERIKEGLED